MGGSGANQLIANAQILYDGPLLTYTTYVPTY
jgi:hypothetical protein